MSVSLPVTEIPSANDSYNILAYDEHDRVTLEHYVLKMAIGKNFVAPVTDLLEKGNAEVLDVGCGPGMWSMEMGSEFQLSTFTGIECHDCFPSNVFPSNTNFLLVDPPIPLPFDDNKFDYVHQRMRYSEYKKEDWKPAVSEIVRVTKVGGWVELIESDMDISKAGEATKYLADKAYKFAENSGIHTSVSRELGTLLRDAGLDKVEEKTVVVPSGNWGGNIGALFKEDMHRIFTAVKLQTSGEKEMNLKEYEANMKRMLDEVEENKSYSTFRIAFGQKAQ